MLGWNCLIAFIKIFWRYFYFKKGRWKEERKDGLKEGGRKRNENEIIL